MSMEQILKVAVERIRSGLLSNEAQVRQAVITPILRGLDWDDSNPMEFVPEFSVDSKKVDYALCRSSANPLIFIEAKRLGGADVSGEEQLFGYAANRGVPFLILTDGNVWNFYLSMAEGIPAERRFYRAELRREENIPEYARFFAEHFQKSLVISGAARRKAEQRHQGNMERTKARNTIPTVWRTLLEHPDEMLRDLLAEAVESECGTKPELDDVEKFLEEQISTSIMPPTNIAVPLAPAPTLTPPTQSQSGGRITGFVLDGKRVEVGFGNRTLAEILKEFQRRDSGFMMRFAARTVGRTRRLVAQSREELYDQSNLVDSSFDMENGWWLGTNLSKRDIRKDIQIACDIAGVNFGSRLTLIER